MKVKSKKSKVEGPALPLKLCAHVPRIFRRKDRRGRLYVRFREAGGKIVTRSTGVITKGAAQAFLALVMKGAAR